MSSEMTVLKATPGTGKSSYGSDFCLCAWNMRCGREKTMSAKQYVVDAFTDKVFHGNQAAVCVLDAYQASNRGGTLYCRKKGKKIFMTGKAVLYSVGELFV